MAEHQASAAQRFFTDLLVAHLTSPHFVQDEAERLLSHHEPVCGAGGPD